VLDSSDIWRDFGYEADLVDIVVICGERKLPFVFILVVDKRVSLAVDHLSNVAMAVSSATIKP